MLTPEKVTNLPLNWKKGWIYVLILTVAFSACLTLFNNLVLGKREPFYALEAVLVICSLLTFFSVLLLNIVACFKFKSSGKRKIVLLICGLIISILLGVIFSEVFNKKPASLLNLIEKLWPWFWVCLTYGLFCTYLFIIGINDK